MGERLLRPFRKKKDPVSPPGGAFMGDATTAGAEPEREKEKEKSHKDKHHKEKKARPSPSWADGHDGERSAEVIISIGIFWVLR